MTRKEEREVVAAMESVFDAAMEAATPHVIDPKTRDALPDEAFGVVFTDSEGKRQRKYPLVVKKDKEKTKELVAKAIQFFHYCNPDWKEQLAKKIVAVIRSEHLNVTISSRSQILKYVEQSSLPKTITVTTPQKKEK